MKNLKILVVLALVSGMFGCMTSPESVSEHHRKIVISSLNFAECGDTAVKINRDNPETRPYYDIDLKISKKLSNLNNFQCAIKFGEDVDNFRIRIVSDYESYPWNTRDIGLYDSLVLSGKIGQNSIVSYISGSSEYRYFKDLKSNGKIYMSNSNYDYFDKTTKSFVLQNRTLWLGYLEIIIE